jgi:hypothetical protein
VLKQFIELSRSVYSWYLAHRDHFPFILLRKTLTFGILAVSFWFIGKQIYSGHIALSKINVVIDLYSLITSSLCVATSTVLGAWEWTLLVKAFGEDIDTAQGMQVHLISNLTKYVPGFIWAYLGKAYLTTKQGVSAEVAAISIISEFVIVFFDGLLLLVLTLPYSEIIPELMGSKLVLQVSTLFFSGVVIASIPLFGHWLNQSLPCPKQVSWRQIILVTIAVLLTWSLLGLGFSILGASSLGLDSLNISRWLFTLALGLLAGQVAFLIPMGLGIREVVFLSLLNPSHSTAFILVIALVFRIELILSEVFCTLIVVGVTRLRNQSSPKGLLYKKP